MGARLMDHDLVGRQIAETLLANMRAGALKKIDLDLIRQAILDRCGDGIRWHDLDALELVVTRRVVEMAS
jgi:hypothetical protein